MGQGSFDILSDELWTHSEFVKNQSQECHTMGRGCPLEYRTIFQSDGYCHYFSKILKRRWNKKYHREQKEDNRMKHEMHDIGQERESPDVAVPEEKRGKTYPTFELNEAKCPFIKDWPTGENYVLMISVHKTGDHEPRPWDYGGDNKAMIHAFEIRKVGYYEDSKEKKT